MSKKAQHLNLKAETADDLSVISGAVQDSILRVQGIMYDQKAKSLTLGLQRYRREADEPSRILSGLRFDGVLSVKSSGIDKSNPEAFLVLLSIAFEPEEEGAGELIFEFSGNGKLRAKAECLEAMLLDRGDPWAAKSVPNHDVGN